MKLFENERRGWILVAFLLLLGLSCVLLAGTLAIRFSPSWSLPANMRSDLDPDSDYLTYSPNTAIQPVDPSILTQPVWINVFLTPGVTIPTRQPAATASPTAFAVPTQTATAPVIAATASPTPTLVYFFTPARTSTSYPTHTRTSDPTSAPSASVTPTFTPITPTSTPVSSMTPGTLPPPQADLQITKSDGVLVYSRGGTLTYTVVVTNNGPSPVTGALVSDGLQPQIASWSWACTSENNGASGCSPADSSLNFSDTVDLPSGATIVYTVTAITRSNAAGNLVNTASVTAPDGIVDPAPGNNSSLDADDLLFSFPHGAIGSNYDGNTALVPAGGSVTLAFDAPLVVGGHPGWDLILYEYPNGSGIAMDFLTLQIGDGSSWYTVFNWGDNIADTHTNMNIAVLGGEEVDNRDFTTPPGSDALYPFNSGTEAIPATGIVFELDGIVPAGTYPYIRILSPVGGDIDGGCEIDAIVIVP